jgi:hypothetical protein
VQNYADFQRVLSERVSDDLMKEEAASPISTFAPTTPHDFRHNFSQPAYSDPSLFIPASQSGLPSPVVITQQRSEGGQVAWARTYAPVLWQGGINQDAFFHFIDCYNEIIKVSSASLFSQPNGGTELFRILRVLKLLTFWPWESDIIPIFHKSYHPRLFPWH